MDFEEILEIEAAKEKEGRHPAIPREMPKTLAAFDTRAVMADLTVIETKCTQLVNEANALEIKTKKQNMEAVNISGKLQELGKAVAKKCTDFLAPYKKVTSSINGPKKRITDAATSAKTIVNQKIFQYKKQEEIEQARQQKLIDEASKKLQESLNEQAEELGIEAPKVAPIQAPKPVKVLRGDSGASVYTRKAWAAEIIKPDEVPREWCTPDMKKINESVRMGKREIPGVKIFEKETAVTRT